MIAHHVIACASGRQVQGKHAVAQKQTFKGDSQAPLEIAYVAHTKRKINKKNLLRRIGGAGEHAEAVQLQGVILDVRTHTLGSEVRITLGPETRTRTLGDLGRPPRTWLSRSCT